uniref:Uncharacterized protein n=1 Tax=Acrobeloides nanus TaxID=290746 RepID=A0A914DMR9_9BILA
MLFKLFTKSQELCNIMQADLENDTEEFVTKTNLKLEFMLTAAKREYRNLKITGTTLAQSKFFSKLENKYSKNG